MAHSRQPDAQRQTRDELVYGKLNQLSALQLASVAILALLLAAVGIFLSGRVRALAARVEDLERQVAALHARPATAAPPSNADGAEAPPAAGDRAAPTDMNEAAPKAPAAQRLAAAMTTPAERRDARWRRALQSMLDELAGDAGAAAHMTDEQTHAAVQAGLGAQRFDDAFRWLRILIDRGSATVAEALAVARAGLEAERWKPALEAARWAATREPPTGGTLLLIAELQHRSGDPAGREATLADLLRHADVRAVLDAADGAAGLAHSGILARARMTLALDQRRIDDAVGLRSSVDANDPGAEPVLRRLGRSLLESRRPREALALFGDLARRNPASPENLDGVGVALLDLMLHDEAVAALEQAVTLEGADANVWFHLGAARAARADLEGALGAFQQSTALDERFAQGHFALAVILARLSRWEDCEKSLERALALDPSLAEVAAGIPALQRVLVGGGEPDSRSREPQNGGNNAPEP
ncbi:MAG: hypothetical protein C4547_08205 [Phycisphaerales bacterium]|nr:MAG: hypothetical protein C4547_08205 [Phycisphaerales bacterium]